MKENTNKNNLPGYPLYPADEDIYTQNEEDESINPEDITTNKESTNDDQLDNNLDVPGSELDDLEENVGSEDEENNYYSLGSDDHNDLDEN